MTKNINDNPNNYPKSYYTTPGGLSTVSDFLRYEGDELHIGKNSLITKEVSNVQQLYAQDENKDQFQLMSQKALNY